MSENPVEKYYKVADEFKANYGLSDTKIEGAHFVSIFRWAMFGGSGYVNYWHLAKPDEIRKVACEMMRALERIISGEYKMSVTPDLY